MLASSREGEQDMRLAAVVAANPPATPVQWLIVPRHPLRFDEVAQRIAAHGFKVLRRSEWGHERQDDPLPAPGHAGCGAATHRVIARRGAAYRAGCSATYSLAACALLKGATV